MDDSLLYCLPISSYLLPEEDLELLLELGAELELLLELDELLLELPVLLLLGAGLAVLLELERLGCAWLPLLLEDDLFTSGVDLLEEELGRVVWLGRSVAAGLVLCS